MAVGLLVLLVALVPSIGLVAFIAWAIFAAVNSNDRRHSEAAYEGKPKGSSGPVLSGVALGCGITMLIPFALIILVMFYMGTSRVSYEANRSSDTPATLTVKRSSRKAVKHSGVSKVISSSLPKKRDKKSTAQLVESDGLENSALKNQKAKSVLAPVDEQSDSLIVAQDGPTVIEMGQAGSYSPAAYRTNSNIGSTRITFFRLAAGIIVIAILLVGTRTVFLLNRSGVKAGQWFKYGHSFMWALFLFVLHLGSCFFFYEILDFEHHMDFGEAIVSYLISMIPFIGAYLLLRRYRVTRNINPVVGMEATIGADILIFCVFVVLEFAVSFFFIEILDFERAGDEVCVGTIVVSSIVLFITFLRLRGFRLEIRQSAGTIPESGSLSGVFLNGGVLVVLIAALIGLTLTPISERRHEPAAVAADRESGFGGGKPLKTYPKWVKQALKNDQKTPYRNEENALIVPSSEFATQNESSRDADTKLTRWINFKFRKQYPDSNASFSTWDIHAFMQADYVSISERKSLGEDLEATLYRTFQHVKIADENRVLSRMYRLYTMRESERRSYFVGFGFLAAVFVLGSTSFFLRRIDSMQKIRKVTSETSE